MVPLAFMKSNTAGKGLIAEAFIGMSMSFMWVVVIVLVAYTFMSVLTPCIQILPLALIIQAVMPATSLAPNSGVPAAIFVTLGT